MKRLTLLLLLLLTSTTISLAQDVALSGRVGLANTPSTIGILQETGQYSNQFIELYVGHSELFGSDSSGGVLDRGALVFGVNYQPRWNLTNPHAASGFGVYANVGARLRYHVGMASGPRRDGEMTMNAEEGYTLTPDVVAGGGVFLRMGYHFELFGEANGAFRSLEGRSMNLGAETALGMRIFF